MTDWKLYPLAQRCHVQSMEKGFWDKDRNRGEMIALIHSELSEALEAIRDPGPSHKISPFTHLEEEMADVLIRVFDFCWGFGLDIDGAVEAKLDYNKDRQYKHGKAF